MWHFINGLKKLALQPENMIWCIIKVIKEEKGTDISTFLAEDNAFKVPSRKHML